jgi:hypothetical protein
LGGVAATAIVKVYVLSSLETQGIKAAEALFGAHLLRSVCWSVSDKVQLVNAIVRSYSSPVEIETEVCGVSQLSMELMCIALRILPGVGKWSESSSGRFRDIGLAAVSNVLGKIVQLQAEQRTKGKIGLIVKETIGTLNAKYSTTEQFKCPVLWYHEYVETLQVDIQANVLRHTQQVVLDLSRKAVLTPPQQKKLTEAQQLIAEMGVTQHPQTAQQ